MEAAAASDATCVQMDSTLGDNACPCYLLLVFRVQASDFTLQTAMYPAALATESGGTSSPAPPANPASQDTGMLWTATEPASMTPASSVRTAIQASTSGRSGTMPPSAWSATAPTAGTIGHARAPASTGLSFPAPGQPCTTKRVLNAL